MFLRLLGVLCIGVMCQNHAGSDKKQLSEPATEERLVDRITTALKRSGEKEREPIQWRDYKSGRQEAQKLHRPALIFFNFQTCTYGQKLKMYTFTHPVLMDFVSATFVPIYVDANQQPELAEKFKIRAFPSVFVVHPDGRTLGPIEGFREPPKLERELRLFLQGD
jgi:thioredoxin-related protein